MSEKMRVLIVTNRTLGAVFGVTSEPNADRLVREACNYYNLDPGSVAARFDIRVTVALVDVPPDLLSSAHLAGIVEGERKGWDAAIEAAAKACDARVAAYNRKQVAHWGKRANSAGLCADDVRALSRDAHTETK